MPVTKGVAAPSSVKIHKFGHTGSEGSPAKGTPAAEGAKTEKSGQHIANPTGTNGSVAGKGVQTTRRFMLESMSFMHRYVPVGLIEHMGGDVHGMGAGMGAEICADMEMEMDGWICIWMEMEMDGDV